MKEIRYPTEEWFTKHKDKSREEAEILWWDKEIDADRPTPFDLDAEHEKEAKKVIRKPANYSLENKTPRERKPNQEKREIITCLRDGLFAGMQPPEITVSNPEKTIDFTLNGNRYTVTLTCHRPPKT